MSNYVKSTDFAAKDSLVSGNPLKLIKGSEINDEFNNIQTSIATKADLASPTFSGNPTCATQAVGNNSTRLANTAFVQQEIADAETAINITGGTIDSVAITGGTISGLTTDLAVADGGTGSSSLTTNAVLLGNGTSALQTVAPGTSGNVLTSDGTTWKSTTPPDPIGVSQTWQDFTSSRTAGTTYTNNTGRPIQVLITVIVSTQTSNFSINGTVVATVANNGFIDYAPFSAIIPNGSTYSVSLGVFRWWELR